jgi:hypothetical protein
MCGPCTGLRYWCEGKPAVWRAGRKIERLRRHVSIAAAFRLAPGARSRLALLAALRRSEAVVRRHFARRIAALQVDVWSDANASIPRTQIKAFLIGFDPL